MASQITIVSIVYSIVCSGADQRKHQSSAPLAFVREVTGDPHKRSITRIMFPIDNVFMETMNCAIENTHYEIHKLCTVDIGGKP